MPNPVDQDRLDATTLMGKVIDLVAYRDAAKHMRNTSQPVTMEMRANNIPALILIVLFVVVCLWFVARAKIG